MNRKIGAIGLLVALVLLLRPTAVRAGSPFDDPSFQSPQGGGAGVEGSSTAPVAAIPPGYTELPAPRSGPHSAPPLRPLQQGPFNPNDPLQWVMQQFSFGTWVSNTFLGSVTGLLLTIAGVLETVAAWGFGELIDQDNPISPTGELTLQSVMFGTPENYTTRWYSTGSVMGSAQDIHEWVQRVAFTLLLLIVLFRGLQLYVQHDRRTVWRFAVMVVSGVLTVRYAWDFSDLMIRAANLVGREITRNYAITNGHLLFLPTSPNQGGNQLLSLSQAIAGLTYWSTAVWLVLQAVKRIVLVNLFLIVSPLTGLALTTDGGWSYAATWFFRFLELLITPIIWAIVLGFSRNLMGAFGVETHPLIGPVVGAYTLMLLPKATAVLGLTAREAARVSSVFTTVQGKEAV
jgi:hypothetical protein